MLQLIKQLLNLTAVWQAASEELYKNQQPGGQQGPQQGYTADAGAGQSEQAGGSYQERR